MNVGADILDTYYGVVDKDHRCRNIKSAQRVAFQGNESLEITPNYYKKLSLNSVSSNLSILSYLERILDITYEDFRKLILIEINLHKFVLKHKDLKTKTYLIKQCLLNRRQKLIMTFKEWIPSNLVTKWIYWNNCKMMAYCLKSILLMLYDTFIVIYDLYTSRRCIYRTNVNSKADPKLLAGSKAAPVFAFAERGIHNPKIFVIGYHELKTISVIRDHIEGEYIGLEFSLGKALISVKTTYRKSSVRMIVWNWIKGEKTTIYEQDPTSNILSDCTLFNWEESYGVGVILRRNTTYNEQCQLVNVLNATIFKQRQYKRNTIIYVMEEKYYQSFVPADLCTTSEDTTYLIDERGDLYALEGGVNITLIFKKKWQLLHKRPKCKVRLISYRNGFLICGPEGVMKRYYQNEYKIWHCSWWMDIYDAKIQNIIAFGKPEYLYVLCPFRGLLKLSDDCKKSDNFEITFEYEKDKVNDIILVQPDCEYLLAVSDRRNILVLTLDDCKQIGKMSFPEKFDKFPYLSNPYYPYVIFISDRVGIFYIYDIENYKSAFVAAKIFIGPHRITSASFSYCGTLLYLWIGGINQKLVYWAVKTNNTYSDFKIILNIPSSDNSVDITPYLTLSGEFYVLLMEKRQPKLTGNRVFIIKFPKKQLVGICTLDNYYRKLYFSLQSLNYVYGSLESNPNKLVKFSFIFQQCNEYIRIEQSLNNVDFLLPFEGEYDLVFSYDYTYTYGLQDGQFVVLDARQEKIKQIYSAYFHRGAMASYEHNKYVGGGIKKCFATKCGSLIVMLAKNGVLTGHKFRNCIVNDSFFETTYGQEVIKQMELVPAESCLSVSLATERFPLNKALLESNMISNRKDKEQIIKEGSKWAHCYATQFSLILIPKDLSPSTTDRSITEDEVKLDKSLLVSDERKINLIKIDLNNEFMQIYCKLLSMFRKYYHRGRMTLPFPLFIINREHLKEFFLRMKDIEAHTKANIKRRMIRTMQETISWIQVFREPFNNAQLIRGILNPEIKGWTVGTKCKLDDINWRRLCEKQWQMRKSLRCGYSSNNVFPINPIMQKRIEVKKETFPDISCLDTAEVLYVSRKTVGRFKESDLKTINQTIQEAAFLKTLRAAIEFYSSGSNIEGICHPYQSPIDYKGLWEKLCTKGTYTGINSFNNAINEIMDKDKTRISKNQTNILLKNLLKLNQARFFEIKDDLICKKCKKVPIYADCTHKPKCYPCFHDLKCTLSKYIFPETTLVVRAPDVSPDLFCKPMRYMNYYRFILHPHIECCSFDPKKGFEVSSSRTDDGKDKQLQTVQTEKPKIIKDALTIVNKPREFPPRNFKLFTKHTETNQNDVIWDESLEELIRICSASNDCELLLRKLFFKCSQRLFCDGQREYLLLKSLKHFMKYTSFFPLHTYLALPWLRDLVQEVTDLKEVQTKDYKKVVKLYPEILTYKKTDYHDPFKIPEWWDKFMKLIAEARQSLNLKLAKIYVMTTYEDLFPKEEESDVSSEDSVDSEMAKSPADVICGYKKVPCHQITDVGLNEEIHRYGQVKVRKKYPVSERLTTRTYNNKFKKDFMRPLEKHFLSKWRNKNQLFNNPRLTMSLTRYDSSKYMEPEKDEISRCSEFEKLPDCLRKRELGNTELTPFYLNKGNLIYNPTSIFKAENNLDNTVTIIRPDENNYRAVPVTNIADPFVPVQPHHPNTKYWRPFTLKWLLSMKKPLSPRLMTIVGRLVSHEMPSEIYDWFKTYVGLINKIQRVIKNRLLDYDLKKINKLQYHEYTKIQKLVYPIKLLETAQWLALIIHRLSIINKDVIDSTENIMSSYCGENIYKKHPMHIPEGRYPIKGKPFDPRKAFKLVVGPRFPNSAENSLIEDLKKTNQLSYQPKMYEPQKDLRGFLNGPVKNSKYVLKLLINRQVLQMSASKSQIHDAPKDWFTWRPLQQGAPNWVMIITVAFASKIFCSTLNNIMRRLYKILRESRKYICRKAAEQNLKKRTNMEDITERDYDHMGRGITIKEEIEQMIWEEPNVTVNYKSPDKTLTKYTGPPSRNETNLMAWRKHEEEFLGKIKRNRWGEKERMEHEIEDMLKADVKGWEMYLEHKRYWAAGFKLDPLHSGFPPMFDKKNKAIIDFGDNFRGSLEESSYDVCPQRPIKDVPHKKKIPKEKKDKKKEKETDGCVTKKKKELLFMKRLILDGPSVRYTTVATYYSNRFDHFTPLNSKIIYQVVSLTVEKLSRERDRILSSLRTIKHHIINFMLLMHIKREHIKKKLSYFCECDDYYMVHYKRQMKLIADEKLNHLYEVDDEDNMFYRNGKMKEKTDDSCNGIVQTKFEDDEPFLEKELTRIMGGTMKQNYLTSLKAPFLKPPCFHIINGLNEKDRLRIERHLKKGFLLEKERDLTEMEFKRQMGWFSVYKEWFKWSFDYVLAYNGVFQMLGIENAIKAEEIKYNSLQKVKWEIRKILTSMDKIRLCYLVNITEYLYVRTTILADIEYFRAIHTKMFNTYEEIEKINSNKDDLKGRILKENPYLKESTLDHLLSTTISLEILKNVSSQDLKTGYKFYFLRKKPVYHFYQLNPQIGKYYEQIRRLYDGRLYPIMSFNLRREMIELRVTKQILHYQIHTGHKMIEEFYERLSKSYKYAAIVLKDMKKLHLTCYRKLNLLKNILSQNIIPVSVYRKQLDQPLWKLVKPYAENKDIRFVAVYRHKTHPKLNEMKELHRFKELLLSDRITELYAVRKTLATEIKLRKLYIKLLKMPPVRYIDGANEDMIQHYKDHIKKSRDVCVATKIKAYDKVLPQLHLKKLISKYVKFIKHKKCLEFERKKKKRKRPYIRFKEETPPACIKGKLGRLIRRSRRSIIHYGALSWFIKGSWELCDFKQFYKQNTQLNTDGMNLITSDNCSLLEHSNKVYDFLRSLIVPTVPPPSPANSNEQPQTVKMLAKKGEEDDIAYQQDEIIFNYLRKQIQKFSAKLEETGKTLKDIPPRELENIFQKWISKLFSNWHIRIPQNVTSAEGTQSCSLLLKEYAEIQTKNTFGFLINLINNHSLRIESRNLDRVKSDTAFTEHDIMLNKCVEHMSTLYPPVNVNERIDECSGTERKCSISVYAKFQNNQDYTLSEEQYLLILNLITEHMKKYNKNTPIPDDNCTHINIKKEDLFKDWIAFAFEKIFLNPVQYVFIKSGERLIKMYDSMENAMKMKHKKSDELKSRDMIVSFIQEYRELEKNQPNIHIAQELAEEERIKIREPLLYKMTSLKRELDELRKQNKRLEIILAKEMRRTYPLFGEEIIAVNERLGALLVDDCSSI